MLPATIHRVRFESKVILLSVCFLVACRREVTEPHALDGREILTRSAAALKAKQTFEYDFVFGHPADPMGYVTGHTRMRRVADARDSWIRVTGHVREQPQFQRKAEHFDYGLDSQRARLVNLTTKTHAEASRTAGANALAANAVYGYLAEFIEAEPFWKELRSAKQIALLRPEMVDGVSCDVVKTVYDVQGRIVEVIWSIARTDHLPRRGRWVNSSYAPGTMTFTIANLRSGTPLPERDFIPEGSTSPEPMAAEKPVAIGEQLPSWELVTTDGQRIASKALLGNIVVLDFWNTWCFICRSIAPQTRALERELAGEGVQFVGVNFFETGDAASYWKQSGAAFPSVVAGEKLAAMLDVSGQPAVAVIDSQGRLRYVEVGATASRTAHIREVVRTLRQDPASRS